MKKLVAFFVRNPLWTNVLMLSIVGFGLLSWGKIKYSFFPVIPPDIIMVEVEYIGGSPEEVEEGVVLKIEENIEGIEGIERVTSVSRENSAFITIEVLRGSSVDKVLQDVKNAVDRISSFPKHTEKPVVYERKYRDAVMDIVLLGKTDLFNLKDVAEKWRDELLLLPEISQVNISGLPRLEFSIEVTEADLRRYLLSFNEIATSINTENINISGGKIETPAEEMLIRSWGKKYHAKELLGLVVRGTSDGTVIRLQDVAQVREKWEDIPDKVFYNTQNAVKIKIERTAQEDILQIAEILKKQIEHFNSTHENMRAVILSDRTISLKQRINLLTRNGIFGLILVISLLSLFLNLRLALWVSIGLPFAFAGMFIIIFLKGITINVISLFGMIIVVGILVDDAIVVGENIYAHYERGKSALQAAIDGAFEMLPAVFTSVLTTIIAFLPFFFLAGFMGKFMWNLALVVIAALIFSLVEAFLILPSHLAHSKGLQPHKNDSPIRQKIERLISFITNRLYAPFLKVSLQHKWITIIAPAAFVFLTIGLLRGGFIGVSFFPFIDFDTLPINLSLVAGRQEQNTIQVLERIEKSCIEVNEDLKKQRADNRDVITGILREVGRNDFSEAGSHIGKLTLKLLDGEVRQMDSYLIASRIREKTGPVPEAQNLTFGHFSMFGKPVSVTLLSSNMGELRHARDLLVTELKNFKELSDVTDSDQIGRREVDITLKPRAYSLGLNLQEIVGQVRQGFYGQQAQRIQRGKDEIRVWVRYTDHDRSSLGFLEQMRIRTPDGAEYPFSELATYHIKRSVSQIKHLDRHRQITIEASLADEETPLLPILQEIQEVVVPRVLSRVKSVKVSFEGQSREQGKVMSSVRNAFPIAFVCMFIVIVLVFRSYAQALLVFGLIPLGIMGAIWGHFLQGIVLNILSIYGFIALTGIVVNDGIVLIDQVNRNLVSGQKLYDAVYNSAVSRLRPILLTSLTTSIGLAPLIFETSRQAKFLIPMAVSVAYGLIFCTFILLIVLPAGYLVLNRLRITWARLVLGADVTPESVEPVIKQKLETAKLHG